MSTLEQAVLSVLDKVTGESDSASESPASQQPRPKMVSIQFKSSEHFSLPLVQEGSHGFLCKSPQTYEGKIIGYSDIAVEWFAKDSKMVKSHLVGE